MRNIDKYTKETAKHIPDEYGMTVPEADSITQNCHGIHEIIFDSFLLGFESAYRAAKSGKLDFQQHID